MWMCRTIPAGVLAVLLTASPGQGGIDLGTTESGAVSLSGGRRQIESWGASQLLLTTNNKLDDVGLTWHTPYSGMSDAIRGVGGDNQQWLIGYIMQDLNGVNYTYDRLARVPVLQVLGRDDEPGAPMRSAALPLPPLPQPITFGDNAHSASPGSSRQRGEGGMLIVPEPAVVLLLITGALVAFVRRPGTRAANE
jgi:hypothetical protein